MKYTYQYIVQNRYDRNANAARKIGDKYVLMTVISKAFSPIPDYVFLNLGLHPDTVTLASMLCICLSALSFVLGGAFFGIIFLLCFVLLDSVDGDMARCIGPTKYGGIFDSFGADLFYSIIPVSVGYFLFTHAIVLPIANSAQILLLSAFVSVSFILYRLINAKVLNFRKNLKDYSGNHSRIAKETLPSKGLVRLIELYRHVVIRGNFFAEPGMIFWFPLLILLRAHSILAWYLAALLAYNAVYLITNFVGTYVFFKNFDQKTEIR